MARRSLLEDVSKQELLDMREIEGLSNSEIAEQLDVTSQTIRNIIGPSSIRRPPRFDHVPVTPDPEPYCAGLLPCGKIEHFIASGKKKISIHNGETVDIVRMGEDGEMILFTGLKKEDINCLIGELNAVLKLMK